MLPTYSFGVMIVALTIGSSMYSMSLGSGMLVGLSSQMRIGRRCVLIAVDDGGRGRDQVEQEFAFEAFLDDLIVQQAEEAAAEAKAQGGRGFRLEGEGGVVELELFQGVAQIGVFGAVDRIEAAVDHLVDFLVAGQRLRRRVGRPG